MNGASSSFSEAAAACHLSRNFQWSNCDHTTAKGWPGFAKSCVEIFHFMVFIMVRSCHDIFHLVIDENWFNTITVRWVFGGLQELQNVQMGTG